MTNVPLIQSLYQAFGEGRIGDIVAACADDVSWENMGDASDARYYGTYRGKIGVGEFFQIISDEINFQEFTPEEFIDGGDTVIVIGRSRETIKKTGATVEDRWIHVHTLRNGKLSQFREWNLSARHARAHQLAKAA